MPGVVRDVMEPAVTIAPEATVEALARMLLETGMDGVCVTEAGKLVGVVTSMDVVIRDRRMHVPSVIAFMDLVIQLPAGHDTREELRKIAASTVRELMTRKPITVTPDTPVPDAAARMVDDHLTILPVLEDGALVGLVTKGALLRAALKKRSS